MIMIVRAYAMKGLCYEGLIPYGMGMRLLDDFVNRSDMYTYIQSYSL